MADDAAAAAVPGSAAIMTAEARRLRAMVEVDLGELDALLDDGCLYVHASGALDTKDAYLERLRSGSVRYTWLEQRDIRIVESGAASVVAHRLVGELVIAGAARPYDAQAAAVWWRRDGILRLGYFQSTRRPSPRVDGR